MGSSISSTSGTTPTSPWRSTEKDLGHATSYDLYNWTQQPPVLPARDGEWDNQHVWAPSIVLRDGLYTLFYSGVTNVPGVYDNYQRIGIATSTDLFNWTPSAQPVFSCEQVPWSFCDPLQPDLTGFRDPFVMPDPSQSGGWLMYYTANDLIDSGTMVVGVARSSGDLSSVVRRASALDHTSRVDRQRLRASRRTSSNTTGTGFCF